MRLLTIGAMQQQALAEAGVLTRAYIDRVEADGGEIINTNAVRQAYTNLLNNNEYDSLKFYWDLGCGIKRTGDVINIIYNLKDIGNNTGSGTPLYVENEGIRFTNGSVTNISLSPLLESIWNKKANTIKMKIKPVSMGSELAIFATGAQLVSHPGIGMYLRPFGNLRAWNSNGTVRSFSELPLTNAITAGQEKEIVMKWSGLAGEQMAVTADNSTSLTVIPNEWVTPYIDYILLGGNRQSNSSLGFDGTMSKFQINDGIL